MNKNDRMIFYCVVRILWITGFCILGNWWSYSQVLPVLTTTNETHSSVPLPIIAPPPGEVFRSIMEMKEDERELYLKDKSLAEQRYIKEKIAEFLNLNPFEREVKFRVWNLRYYFGIVAQIPIQARVQWLNQIPEPYRSALEERLKEWDLLSEDIKKEIISNSRLLEFLVPAFNEPPLPPLPNTKLLLVNQDLEKELAHWKELSTEHRQKILDKFRELLTLRVQEIADLIKQTHPHMEKLKSLLIKISDLPDPEKTNCLKALEHFLQMNVEEQEKFLKKAEFWMSLTPQQRQAWKKLLSDIPMPPLPPIPGFSSNEARR